MGGEAGGDLVRIEPLLAHITGSRGSGPRDGLAEAFWQVTIPVMDGLAGDPATAFHAGDRVRVNGSTGLVEILPRA